MAETEQTRPVWTTEKVRAADLAAGDIVFVSGGWTEVLDVWGSEDNPHTDLGATSETAHNIMRMINQHSADHVVVRCVDTRRSTATEVADFLTSLVGWDLVEVQVQKV